MEYLFSTPITDKDETIYGVEPPSNSIISSAVNDLINEIKFLESQIKELKKPKWESGYLRAKYG